MHDAKAAAGQAAKKIASLLPLFVTVLVLLGQAPVPVFADSAPDLTVQSLSLSPQEPSLGDSVTFTITIKNQGDGNAPASQAVFYLDNDVIGTRSIIALGPGMSTTATLQWVVAKGTHTVKVIADGSGSISESDETNNTATYTFTPLAPDLEVTSITWSPTAPSQGDSIEFLISISNLGTAASKATTIDLSIDGGSRGMHDIPRIEPGSTVNDVYTWIAKTGSHTVIASVDKENKLTESDELNNEKTVLFLPEAADLVISEIIPEPAAPSKNDSVSFLVTVTNQGTGRAGTSHLAFTIDEETPFFSPVDELEAGSSQNRTFQWTAGPDTHTFSFTADFYQRIPEADENNNKSSIKLTTLEPDLTIADILWKPLNPAVGDMVTISVKVSNQGAGTAPATQLVVYIDGKFQGKYNIQAIAGGGIQTIDVVWNAGPGSHIISATADCEQAERETNESNNKLSKSIVVIPPDLLISDIAWEPKNPDIGDTVFFSANITNQGSGKADISHIGFYMDGVLLTSSPVPAIGAGDSIVRTYKWKSIEGRHTFKALVDFNDYITEADEENNAHSVTVIPNIPDLVVSGVTWSPSVVKPGSEVVFDVSIKNTGMLTTVPSRVSFYLDGENIGFSDIGAVRPDETVTTEFTWPAASNMHTVEIRVDATSTVQEIDEENNTHFVILPPPELVVEDVSWMPESAVIGEDVTFTVTLRNLGEGASRPCSASCSFNDDYPVVLDFPAIQSGETATASFIWTAVKGNHVLKVAADSSNLMTETDETNNQSTINYSTLTPDLTIETLDWKVADPLVQDEVIFTIVVFNAGSDTAAPSMLEYRLDDREAVVKNVPGIPAGETVEITIEAILPSGEHSFQIELDPDNAIAEVDETDNTRTITFDTSAADLVIKSITWEPLDAVAGDDVTLTATVENRGKNTAGGTVLQFCIDGAGIGEIIIGEIGVGETLTAKYTWTITPGLHEISVLADYGGDITESDETNNTLARTFALGGPESSGDDNNYQMPVTGDIPEKGLLEDSWLMIIGVAIVFGGSAFFLIYRSIKKA